ncbi:MAG: hypothetical protein COX81_01385 [Candidatus Magasanikbacteria bacterium CG_4_10_14_0_2_um_filter_37_12]|uniref:Transcobalamin-like C-terminal domain-containing protein n=1 Tax=Candidatus Magasanikbacteria bacterium CG_4_10_14_0_2_um_filter_37_12 TaxID=1974637 RepID=A0A2M7V8L9_9BACT|nr:MAG: hypothetical protein COX81_01385 [Candidatus Magasanikbacteria bacterium CG_4_10_14_0_2_um_filter_37_12]
MQNTKSKILILGLLLIVGAGCNQIPAKENQTKDDNPTLIEINTTTQNSKSSEQMPTPAELPKNAQKKEETDMVIVQVEQEKKSQNPQGVMTLPEPKDDSAEEIIKKEESTDQKIEEAETENTLEATLSTDDKEYQLQMPEGSSVYDLMTKASLSTDFTFSANNYPGIGFFIKEINGVKNNKQAGLYWIYYLEGKPAKVGVSDYILKPGDKIAWKYEVPNF